MTPVIILAGTHVWARDAWDTLCPCPLLPVANRLLVRHALHWLREAGLRAVAICANDTTIALQSALGDGAGDDVDLTYYVDRTPRGPAGCCSDAASLLGGEHYVAIDGSILPTVDLLAVLGAHVRSGSAATVVVEAKDRQSNGDERLTPAGVYVFARRALELVGPTGYQDIKEVLIPRLRREREPVTAYRATEPALRVQSLDGYLAAQAWQLCRIRAAGSGPAGYTLRHGACVHDTATVAPDARLLGDVMVGPGTTIGAGAIVVGPAVIGADCVVDTDSVVGRSVLWDGGWVEPGARVDLCVVTSGAVVPTGAAVYRTIHQANDGPRPRVTAAHTGAAYDLVRVRR